MPRRLTPEERRLWRQVTRNDARLRPEEIAADEIEETAPPPPARKLTSGAAPSEMHSLPPQDGGAGPLKPGVYAGVDAVTARRIRRGGYPIDRTLDLHGLNQAEAHAALREAVERAYQAGQRCLLVITGKGGRGGREGVLRERLPAWLSDALFKPYVLAYDAAVPRHGGGGAFYLLIRRKRTKE